MEKWRKDLADQKLEEEAEKAREQQQLQQQQQLLQLSDDGADLFTNMFWAGGLPTLDGEVMNGWNNAMSAQWSREGNNLTPTPLLDMLRAFESIRNGVDALINIHTTISWINLLMLLHQATMVVLLSN